jgi:hypothetical protein
VLSAIIEMADFCEQRTCIKFCFKLEKTATEWYEMLKTAFGEHAVGCSQNFHWFFGLRPAELRLMTNAVVDQCPVQREK